MLYLATRKKCGKENRERKHVDSSVWEAQGKLRQRFLWAKEFSQAQAILLGGENTWNWPFSLPKQNNCISPHLLHLRFLSFPNKIILFASIFNIATFFPSWKIFCSTIFLLLPIGEFCVVLGLCTNNLCKFIYVVSHLPSF